MHKALSSIPALYKTGCGNTVIIRAHGRYSQKDEKFKAIFYRVSLRPAWAQIQDPAILPKYIYLKKIRLGAQLSVKALPWHMQGSATSHHKTNKETCLKA